MEDWDGGFFVQWMKQRCHLWVTASEPLMRFLTVYSGVSERFSGFGNASADCCESRSMVEWAGWRRGDLRLFVLAGQNVA